MTKEEITEQHIQKSLLLDQLMTHMWYSTYDDHNSKPGWLWSYQEDTTLGKADPELNEMLVLHYGKETPSSK